MWYFVVERKFKSRQNCSKPFVSGHLSHQAKKPLSHTKITRNLSGLALGQVIMSFLQWNYDFQLIYYLFWQKSKKSRKCVLIVSIVTVSVEWPRNYKPDAYDITSPYVSTLFNKMRKFYRILRNKGRSKQKLQFVNGEGQTIDSLRKIL